jgi:hypothetical protein
MEDSRTVFLKIINVLSNEYSIAPPRVKEYLNTILLPEEIKTYSATLRSLNAIGKYNPRWVGDRILDQGYFYVKTPTWFTGISMDGTRVAEHIIVYCLEHSLTEIPKGFVIHHVDLNPLNNVPSNLLMLTVSEHIKLHRKLKGDKLND